ncbi:MAG: zinc-binding alcohol dehydrogenase family protein [Myxococcota bacterium]
MKAVVQTRPLPISHPESLVDTELPRPEPSEHDLLVEVRAVAVNPVDFKIRAQREPSHPGATMVLGWDASGVVTARGSGVALFEIGDEVYFAGSVQRPGCNSEFCLVDERIAARKPKRLDFAEAAAIPLTALTAYEALIEHLSINQAKPGERLLIIGGAGGVGSMAIQLARLRSPLRVIATASRPQSMEWARTLGAHHVIDHRAPLEPQLRELGATEIEYVFCTSDTDPYFSELVELVAPRGSIAFIVDPKAPLDMRRAQLKSLKICWELMFTRSIFQSRDMIEQHRILTEVARLLDAGGLRTTLRDRLSPICATNLREAHARLEAGRTIGKIVLEGWS